MRNFIHKSLLNSTWLWSRVPLAINKKKKTYWRSNHQHVENLFLVLSQQTFQRLFNVVFWLMWRHDVRQRHINVETTLCISTLTWTTLDKVETALSCSTSSFTTLVNVKTTLWKWPLLKRTTTKNNSKSIPGIQSFSYYFIIFACSPC